MCHDVGHVLVTSDPNIIIVRKYNQLFVNFIIVSCALLIVNIYPKSGHA